MCHRFEFAWVLSVTIWGIRSAGNILCYSQNLLLPFGCLWPCTVCLLCSIHKMSWWNNLYRQWPETYWNNSRSSTLHCITWAALVTSDADNISCTSYYTSVNRKHSDNVLRALICLISLDFLSLKFNPAVCKQTRNTNWPNKQTAVTRIYSRHFLKWLVRLSVNAIHCNSRVGTLSTWNWWS